MHIQNTADALKNAQGRIAMFPVIRVRCHTDVGNRMWQASRM